MNEENVRDMDVDEILADEVVYADFVRLLERAEEEGKLPYKCPNCDFTTIMLTEVFYHRAEDCSGLNFCNLCGLRSPDVHHYLLHGFECLWEGSFVAPADGTSNALPDTVSEMDDVDLSISTEHMEDMEDVIDIDDTEIIDEAEIIDDAEIIEDTDDQKMDIDESK